VLNLLSNASKYSPENTTISFNVSMHHSCLLVEVQDQGIGIPAENQEDIFTPYHRVRQDRQTYQGIGLGLAVARQIIEAHDGKIWVESERGKGSIFKFILAVKPHTI
jgi:two-component system sensor histidine kinase VicK